MKGQSFNFFHNSIIEIYAFAKNFASVYINNFIL